MIKLCKILLEGSAGKASEFISSGMIPFSPTITQRLINKKLSRVKGNHVTGAKGLKTLVKLQGTKKAISATSFLPADKAIDMGVLAGGGIFARVSGDLVVNFPQDAGSSRDRSGRRWVYPSEFKKLLGNWSKINAFSKAIAIRRDNLAISICKKYKLEPARRNYDVSDIFKYGPGKAKAEFIKRYIDMCEDVVRRNIGILAHDLKKAYEEDKVGDWMEWNELFLTNIKIEWVALSANKYIDTDLPDYQKIFKNTVLLEPSEIRKKIQSSR